VLRTCSKLRQRTNHRFRWITAFHRLDCLVWKNGVYVHQYGERGRLPPRKCFVHQLLSTRHVVWNYRVYSNFVTILYHTTSQKWGKGWLKSFRKFSKVCKEQTPETGSGKTAVHYIDVCWEWSRAGYRRGKCPFTKCIL